MSSDRGTSRPPPAAGDENGGQNAWENGEDGAIARRLRVLGSVCAALMVAVLATAAAIGWSAARPGAGDLMESPPADSFLVAASAMLLVLLASAVYGRILRRQAAAEPEESEEAGEPEARETLAAVAARLRAYSWATGASFGMLAAAAALGAMVASTGKAPFYGLVICVAALFSMVARWPRRSGFDLALRSGRPDAVSRAAAWRSLAQPFASHRADRAEQRAGGGTAARAGAGDTTETGSGAGGNEATDGGAGGNEATGGGAGGRAPDASAGSDASGAARGDMGGGPG